MESLRSTSITWGLTLDLSDFIDDRDVFVVNNVKKGNIKEIEKINLIDRKSINKKIIKAN